MEGLKLSLRLGWGLRLKIIIPYYENGDIIDTIVQPMIDVIANQM